MAGWAAAFAVVLVGAPASGLDPQKAAEAMAHKAAAAYEQGDHSRAAQLYFEAYRQDPQRPDYLYGAARSEQIAGLLDRAEEHFAAFIALPGADPQRVEQAKGRLQELRGRRADERAQLGDAALRKGELLVAAQLFLEAADLAPTRPVLRFKAGAALWDGGRRDEAKFQLERYLREAADDAPERARARLLLEPPATNVAMPATPTAPVAATANPVATVVAPAPIRPASRWWAWGIAGSGGALAAVGTLMYLNAVEERAQVDLLLTDKRYDGLITGTSFEEARAWADDIAGKKTRAAALGGLGVAALVTGVALVRSDPAPVAAIVPRRGGWQAEFAWRF
jgi:tetratricopeptide (TPR) repeat protein